MKTTTDYIQNIHLGKALQALWFFSRQPVENAAGPIRRHTDAAAAATEAAAAATEAAGEPGGSKRSQMFLRAAFRFKKTK